MNSERTNFIKNLTTIYNHSIIDKSDSDIIMKVESNSCMNDQIYSILLEDNKNFFLHDFEFDDDLENEDISNLDIIVDRTRVIKEFDIRIYLNDDQFLTRNVFVFPEGDIYILNRNLFITRESDFHKDYNRYLDFVKLIKDSSDFSVNQNNFSFILEGSKPFHINITKGFLLKETKYLKKVLSINNYSTDKSSFIEEFRIIFKTNLSEYIKVHKYKDLNEFTPDIETFMKEVYEDYRILISNFSFKELKSQFIDEKNKYTLLLNNHISNVIKLIYSIPLSAGLSIILKIEGGGDPSNTILFIFAFIFFAIVSIVILIHNYTSLKLTHILIMNEERKLKKIDFDNDTSLFERDFKDHFKMFYTKISLTKILSIILIFIFIGFGIYFFISLNTVGEESIKGFIRRGFNIFANLRYYAT